MGLDRRSMLGGVGGAVALAAAGGAGAAPVTPGRTFVLVHGAWHGGWCWRLVAGRLRAAGQTVFTPTLTGLGERAHLARADTGLDTHMQDVAAVLRCEELRDVVLVGHSYGGLVIAGATALAPESVGRLVYLDAILPMPGRGSSDPARAEAMRATSQDGGITIPTFSNATDEDRFGVMKGAGPARDWLDRRLTPHPFKALLDIFPPERLPPERPRTYIACTEPALGMIPRFHQIAQTEPGWTYRTLATGHDAMLTAPDALTAMLLAA